VGFLSNLFGKPKTVSSVVLRNVLGEVLVEIPGRSDLIGADLTGLNLAHVDLSGISLFGANLERANLFGARLIRTSFCNANLRGAEISFANAYGADFSSADLTDTLMYQTETKLAKFEQASVSEHSDIPGRKFTGSMKMIS
jgi:uncharacterized protein YjbI with pentapeptide repeats